MLKVLDTFLIYNHFQHKTALQHLINVTDVTVLYMYVVSVMESHSCCRCSNQANANQIYVMV